jgi:hypothetical protein
MTKRTAVIAPAMLLIGLLTAAFKLVFSKFDTGIIPSACESEKELRATPVPGAKTVMIHFRNASPEKLHIFSKDVDGSRLHRGELLPHESLSFATWPTHPWIVADEAGECMTVLHPTNSDLIHQIE